MRSPRAGSSSRDPASGHGCRPGRRLQVPLTQAGGPTPGILLCAVTGPATTPVPRHPDTCVIFTVFSRLPQEGTPWGL